MLPFLFSANTAMQQLDCQSLAKDIVLNAYNIGDLINYQ